MSGSLLLFVCPPRWVYPAVLEHTFEVKASIGLSEVLKLLHHGKVTTYGEDVIDGWRD